MSESTDALEYLAQQHTEVEELFEKIEDADDSDEKKELFGKLADHLAAHSAIEEKIFYPAVLDDETCELLLESTEEHLAAKRLIADLLELDPDDEHWDAKMHVLREQVLHHAKEMEEGKVFPILEAKLSDDQRFGLGNELVAMFEELIEGEPRMMVPDETREAAPLMVSF